MGATYSRAEFCVENLTQGVVLARRVVAAGESRARRKSLSGRVGMDAACGLWIAPCEAVHTFDIHFAIDVIFLDRDFRICKIRSALCPYRVAICLRADSALQLVSGRAGSTRTNVGDRLSFRRDGLRGSSDAPMSR